MAGQGVAWKGIQLKTFKFTFKEGSGREGNGEVRIGGDWMGMVRQRKTERCKGRAPLAQEKVGKSGVPVSLTCYLTGLCQCILSVRYKYSLWKEGVMPNSSKRAGSKRDQECPLTCRASSYMQERSYGKLWTASFPQSYSCGDDGEFLRISTYAVFSLVNKCCSYLGGKKGAITFIGQARQGEARYRTERSGVELHITLTTRQGEARKGEERSGTSYYTHKLYLLGEDRRGTAVS